MKKLKFLSVLAICESVRCNFAAVKYGAVITDMKGSVGGQTFKGTGSGGVMQNKINSASQAKNGGTLSVGANQRLISPQLNSTNSIDAWRSLTDTQRNTWNAGAVNFPFTNKFGELYTGSGYQVFMSFNNSLQAIGQSIIVECPDSVPLEPTPIFEVSQAAAPGSPWELNVDIPTGYKMILSAGNTQSDGKAFDKGRMKAIVIVDSATVMPLNLNDAYRGVFGKIPREGKVYLTGKLTKADAGRNSNLVIVAFSPKP